MKITHVLCVAVFIVLSFSVISSFVTITTFAALPKVKDGDLIEYGYTLVVDGKVIEEHTQSNPVAERILPDLINPPGLYDELIGMTLSQPKDVVIPPDKGFSPNDPKYGYLAGKTLYYYDLEVYSINGKYITDFNTAGSGTSSFGYYFIRVVIGLLGVAGVGALSYGGFIIYKKFFSKRCVVCKKVAVGRCKKCGRTYCKACYAAGCPFCGSRKLILFK